MHCNRFLKVIFLYNNGTSGGRKSFDSVCFDDSNNSKKNEDQLKGGCLNKNIYSSVKLQQELCDNEPDDCNTPK